MIKRLLGLVAILFLVLLPVSQGIAMISSGGEPLAETCGLLPDAPAMPDCSSLQAKGSCNSTCVCSQVGEPTIADGPLFSSPLGPNDHVPHFGRLLSGPDPFPPKS